MNRITDINTFLTQVLSNPNFHIPVEANFIVGFSDLQERIIPNLSTAKVPDQTSGVANLWSKIPDNDIFFANGVSLPGETIKAGRAGFSASGETLYGGLLSSPVLNGRTDLVPLEIDFLETNQSFVDNVIRPWIINASHFGLFARDSSQSAQNQNFKTNITINFLDKQGSDSDFVSRKRIYYENAVPISVAAANFNYGGSKAGVRSIKTTWLYSTYSIS